jgi:hypothetical protein
VRRETVYPLLPPKKPPPLLPPLLLPVPTVVRVIVVLPGSTVVARTVLPRVDRGHDRVVALIAAVGELDVVEAVLLQDLLGVLHRLGDDVRDLGLRRLADLDVDRGVLVDLGVGLRVGRDDLADQVGVVGVHLGAVADEVVGGHLRLGVVTALAADVRDRGLLLGLGDGQGDRGALLDLRAEYRVLLQDRARVLRRTPSAWSPP